MREIVFDTETTGLNPLTGDRMVEIGCVELINRVETGKSFHSYFNPERAMDPAAEAIHGLSETFLASKPLFEDVVEDLLDFLGESPLVAHNARFDFSFLNYELGQCGRLKMSDARMIDTLQLARQRHPGAKHSLDALCTRFGIDRSHRIKHGALLDAELLAQVYIELTGGRQIGLGLASEMVPQASPLVSAAASGNGAAFRRARVFAASPEELARHRKFLDTLKEPLWLMGDALPAIPAATVAIDVESDAA
jgi:DNA polymerase III subunit epsilon